MKVGSLARNPSLDIKLKHFESLSLGPITDPSVFGVLLCQYVLRLGDQLVTNFLRENWFLSSQTKLVTNFLSESWFLSS